ncbi:C2 domain-containing protein [Entamoeba marina]
MELDITLTCYGVAGEPTTGYITMKVTKPLILTYSMIGLYQIDTLFSTPHSESSKKGTHKDFYHSSTKHIEYKHSVCMFNCFPSKKCDYIEYAPGIYPIPFEFTLPNTFPPMFVLSGSHAKLKYQLQAVFYTIDKGCYQSSFCDIPILYNKDVTEIIPTTTTQLLDNILITVHQSQNSYYQGEEIIFYLSAKSFDNNSPPIQISFVGEHSEGCVCHQQKYNSTVLTFTTTEIDNLKFIFPVSYVVPPTVVSKNNSFLHYILIQNKSKIISIPIKIIARLPSKENIELYSSTFKVHIQPEPIFHDFLQRIQPIGLKISVDGIERVITSDGNDLYVNHLDRVVCDSNGEPITNMVYPNWDSVCLPKGETIAKFDNIKFIFNHTNGDISLFDDFHKSPNALLSNCHSPIVTITVLEAVGLNCSSKLTPPTVYAAIYAQPWKKSKKIKSVNPIFRGATFIIRPISSRKNVIVYLYDKQNIYDVIGHGLGEESATIPDTFSLLNKIQYPQTMKMKKQVEIQQAYCYKSFHQPYLVLQDGLVCNTNSHLYSKLL